MSKITKDTMVIVYYMNVDSFGTLKEKVDFLNEIRDSIKRDDIYQIILPVYNESSRVDCINPKYLSEEEYKSIENKIQQLDDSLSEAIVKIRKKNEAL